MSALAMKEPSQMLLGVAVSSAGEPLHLVCNTGPAVIRGRRGNLRSHGDSNRQSCVPGSNDGPGIPPSRAGILDLGIQDIGSIGWLHLCYK